MKTSKNCFLVLLLGLFGLSLVFLSCEDQVNLETDQVVIQEEPQPINFNKGDPFDDAELFFEFNTSDNDLGLQLFVDNDGWYSLGMQDSDGDKNLAIKASGPLGELGITELRFESSEPSPGEVLDAFPAGEYQIAGKTVEGDKLLSKAELSHDFLDPADVDPEDGAIVDPGNLVVTWEAEGAENVEIIIEDEEEENILSILITEDEGELTIPPEFLEEGAEYKLEVIATHENGNKTIVESEFTTNGVAI
jgi:hypothetical protein